MSMELSRELKIMRALVVVAWADDLLDHKELTLLKDYGRQFELSQNEINMVYIWILNPEPIDCLSQLDIQEDDKLFVFSQVWVMAYIDGKLDQKEQLIISKLKKIWDISNEIADELKETTMNMQNQILNFKKEKNSTTEILKALDLVKES
ncbi:MAG: TerB family tellurite resistance protein [Candidatus Cloacimonetes bacterium]|nr:TerB family tellurite resistance protein [Candidatus Cloacimonadota bacterium]